MSKKDYVLIAKVFADNNGIENVQALAVQLAKVLGGENPRFDSGRFLKACGVEN